MKNIKLSLIALIAIGNIAYGGGDITPVPYYQTTDITEATVAYEEAVVEPVYEAPISEPIYVESEPIIKQVEPQPISRPEPVYRPKPISVPVEEPKAIVVRPAPIPVKSPTNISPSGFYAGLGITGTRYQSNCDCSSSISGSSSSSLSGASSLKSQRSGKENNLAVLARVGYDFNRYVGIEARGIRTIGSGDATISHGGLFVKPMLPVTDGLNAYGLVGFGKTKVTGSLQNVNAESLALGAGVEYDLSKDSPKEGRYSREFDGQGDQEKGIGLFVDYERLVVESNAPDLDTLSAGITYDF